jgi:hypothetical protein
MQNPSDDDYTFLAAIAAGESEGIDPERIVAVLDQNPHLAEFIFQYMAEKTPTGQSTFNAAAAFPKLEQRLREEGLL